MLDSKLTVTNFLLCIKRKRKIFEVENERGEGGNLKTFDHICNKSNYGNRVYAIYHVAITVLGDWVFSQM